jgi:hypothetical protein
MWVKQVHRKDLFEILSGNGSSLIRGGYFSHSLPVDPIYEENLYLIWDSNLNEPKGLPVIIIVADGKLRDFLAWALTYLSDYRPFTAYFRVLEVKVPKNFKFKIDVPSLNSLETASIGIILGETLTFSPELAKSSSFSPIACSSTISYPLSRGIAIGATEAEIDIICDNWLLARKLTEQPERNLDITNIKSIWKIIFSLKNNKFINKEKDAVWSLLADACYQLKEEGKIKLNLWSLLTNNIDELMTAPKEMAGPREDRVLYFQKLISINSFQKISDKNIAAFIFGYLGSLIGPGSMSHLDLITPKMTQMNNILMWYGLCAGLHKKSELLSSFNVLGRRLLRELLKPDSLLNRPSADISVCELQVMLEGQNKIMNFRTFSLQNMAVELFPYVSTYLNWPKREPAKQLDLLANQQLWLRVRSLVENALEIQKIITGSSELSENKSEYKKSYRRGKKKTNDY